MEKPFTFVHVQPCQMRNSGFSAGQLSKQATITFFRIITVGLVCFTGLLSGSCVTTRYSPETACLRALQENSKILIPWLPERNRQFYLKGLKNIHRKNAVSLTYMVQVEWDLKAAGVLDPLDSADFYRLGTC